MSARLDQVRMWPTRFYRYAVEPLLVELWAMRHPVIYARSLGRAIAREWRNR